MRAQKRNRPLRWATKPAPQRPRPQTQVKVGSVLDITIPQSIVLGAHQQGAVACFRHEDGYRSWCGVSRVIVRKPCAGGYERYSLVRTRSDGRMYCPSCDPSCVGSCFGTKVTLLEGMCC